MRIGIDYISSFGSGGNGTYTRELVGALAIQGHNDRYFLYTYVHHLFPSARYETPLANIQYKGAYLPSFGWRTLTRIGERASRMLLRHAVECDGLDIMHFTNPLFFVEGLTKKTKIVVTIHDLAFLKNRAWVGRGSLERIRAMLPGLVKRADALIAVSQCTKMDLCGAFPGVEKKTSVVFEGVSTAFKPTETGEDFFQAYGVRKPYVLSVGEIQPRKNLPVLLEAFSILPQALRSSFQLVLIGAPRDEEERRKLLEAIQKFSLEDRVHVLEYVPQEDLIKFYSKAEVFVFVPLYEGFGLPVLEAMACGTAVLCSSTSSLPEVGGEACLYADPTRSSDVAEKLKQLLEHENVRATLRSKGIERAKEFGWDKAAQKTRALYHQLTQ